MKKVGIDGQIFSYQQFGGVSRYFFNLLNNDSPSDSAVEIYPHFTRHLNQYLRAEGIGLYCPSSTSDQLLRHDLHLLADGTPAVYPRPDVIHSSYYIGAPWNSDRSVPHCPMVSTLHDMTPECYPGFFPYGNPHFQKKEWFDNSDLIISVSDSSAADLLDFNPALAGRLQTIHLGSAFASYDVSQIETGLHREPYFLYVGTRSSYKNWLQLLRATGRCAETVGLPSLICAGGGPATESERELIHQFGLTGCVHFMSPDDQELAALYAGATAVLVPSLAEGFSLPLVEALAFDVPVICSDIPVHQEIGGGFCTFLSPHHTHAWTDLIAAFNSLKSPSQLLGEDYQAKVDYYSFDRCVEAHRLAYALL